MRILLLGAGMQGKAALHDLANNREVTEIIVADRDFDALESYVHGRAYGERVRCARMDATRPAGIERLLVRKVDVVIDLLPPAFCGRVAALSTKQGVHVVNASYRNHEITKLASKAKAKEVTILPEFGFDPGIDLVMLGEAVRSLDRVDEIYSYGGGVPEPEAANNPLKYKVSWTLEGVLKSYRRKARLIRDHRIVGIHEDDIFCPENIHELEIEGVGRLEAFPNGDALRYVDMLGIDPSTLHNAGRYAMRWPGHSAFWKKMVDLHLLDDSPVRVDSVEVDRKRFLAAALAPYLQYGDSERDLALAIVKLKGKRGKEACQVTYRMIDKRDLDSGLTAMSRAVGYTASIGALMIGTGKITERGVLSPIKDIPYEPFVQELGKRGIVISRRSSVIDAQAC